MDNFDRPILRLSYKRPNAESWAKGPRKELAVRRLLVYNELPCQTWQTCFSPMARTLCFHYKGNKAIVKAAKAKHGAKAMLKFCESSNKSFFRGRWMISPKRIHKLKAIVGVEPLSRLNLAKRSWTLDTQSRPCRLCQPCLLKPVQPPCGMAKGGLDVCCVDDRCLTSKDKLAVSASAAKSQAIFPHQFNPFQLSQSS